MKYFYPAVVALCLLIAIERSNSQKRTFNLGTKGGTLTAVIANVWTSPDYTLDWGLGWLIGGERFSEHNSPHDVENCTQMYSKYLGHSNDYAGSGATVEQAITVDLKIPISIFDIIGFNVDQKSNGYLIRIHCTKHLPDFESWLKVIGDDTWLYITLADAKADVAVLQDFKPTVFIKKILIFQSVTSLQLTFMLKGPVNSAVLIPAEGNQDILVAISTPKEEQLAIRKDR